MRGWDIRPNASSIRELACEIRPSWCSFVIPWSSAKCSIMFLVDESPNVLAECRERPIIVMQFV